MFKIRVLGSGAMNCRYENNFHCMYLLEWENGKNLLLDCGSDFKHACHYHNINPADINAVYISHLHGDHCGGMEHFGFMTYFHPNQNRPILFIPNELRKSLWSCVMCGGMDTLSAYQLKPNEDEAHLTTYFDVRPIDRNGSFTYEDVKFTPVQLIHVVQGTSFMPSYGLFIKTEKTTIFWTADSQYAPNQLRNFYDMSNLIINDCECIPPEYKSGVHSNYIDLVELPSEIKNKMYLTHYQDNPKYDAENDGFKGFLKRGQIIEVE